MDINFCNLSLDVLVRQGYVRPSAQVQLVSHSAQDLWNKRSLSSPREDIPYNLFHIRSFLNTMY